MRRIGDLASNLFWGAVWTGVTLAVLLLGLHLVRSHAPGILGNVAAGAESAITPQG